MPKPTERALKRKPQAVVMLAWEKDAVAGNDPGDRDFEWFMTTEGLTEYFDHIEKWNTDDVTNHGDLVHLLAEVTDTSTEPMTLGRVAVTPDDNVELLVWKANVEGDVSLLFEPARAKAASPKAKVKAKKPSSAAPATAGVKPDDGTAPKPKAVRNLRAKGGSPVKPGGAPKPKAQQLKERLAAKKAAEAEPEVKASEDEHGAEFVVKKPSTAKEPATA